MNSCHTESDIEHIALKMQDVQKRLKELSSTLPAAAERGAARVCVCVRVHVCVCVFGCVHVCVYVLVYTWSFCPLFLLL